jgi:hypothetical protein
MASTPASEPSARPVSGGQKALSIGWMSWPAVLFVVALIVFPLIYAVWLSMQNVSLGTTAKFSGFDNYKELFAESEFRNAFKLTFVLYGVAIVMQLVVGTWLALVLNRIERFKNIIRTIAITPFLLPPVVVGMVAVVILDPSLGVANWVLAQTEIVLRNGTLRWTDELRGAPPLALTEVQALLRNPGQRHNFRLDATPPPAWGERFSLRAMLRTPLLSTGQSPWQSWSGELYADFSRADVSLLRQYIQIDHPGVTISSGQGALRALQVARKKQPVEALLMILRGQ